MHKMFEKYKVDDNLDLFALNLRVYRRFSLINFRMLKMIFVYMVQKFPKIFCNLIITINSVALIFVLPIIYKYIILFSQIR